MANGYSTMGVPGAVGMTRPSMGMTGGTMPNPSTMGMTGGTMPNPSTMGMTGGTTTNDLNNTTSTNTFLSTISLNPNDLFKYQTQKFSVYNTIPNNSENYLSNLSSLKTNITGIFASANTIDSINPNIDSNRLTYNTNTGTIVPFLSNLALSTAPTIAVNELTPNLDRIQNFPVVSRNGIFHIHQDPTTGQRYSMSDEFHGKITQIILSNTLGPPISETSVPKYSATINTYAAITPIIGNQSIERTITVIQNLPINTYY